MHLCSKFQPNEKLFVYSFFFFYYSFAFQDGSHHGKAPLDLFHHLLFSYSYYPRLHFSLILKPDLGTEMHWVCLIYTGTDLFGWHA